MTRLKDVAAAAGVSPSVASRVLNADADARVNAETRKRVLEAAARLNYVPDHRARALRLSRSGAVGLVVPEVNNAIFASLYAGVQETCQAQGSAVLLGQLNAQSGGRNGLAALVGNGRVDGVILQRAEGVSDDSLGQLIELPIPVVLFNSRLDGHVGSVALDDHRAVAIALEHLASLGHRDVGFIAGADQHDAAARRLEGFTTSIAALGMRTRSEWIQPGGWEAPQGAAAMRRLLAADERPTAVVAASTNAAVGALSAALAGGVSVPDELSLICVQDAWVAEYTTPAISAVAMPMHAAGGIAARMLLDHLGGTALEDVVVAQPRPVLHERGSTAPVAD